MLFKNESVAKYEAAFPIHSALRSKNQALAIDAIKRAKANALSLETTETFEDCDGVVEGFEEDADCGLTPLLLAAKLELNEVVEVLVKAKADLTAINEDGWNALHFAAINNDVKSMAILIKAGMDANSIDFTNGDTPLHIAAQNGSNESISVLVSAGADINFRNNPGHTALVTAAIFNQFATIKKVISINSDISQIEEVFYCISNSFNTQAALWLIENGATGSFLDGRNLNNALYRVVKHSHRSATETIEFIRFLTDKFSESWLKNQIASTNEKGETPIDAAQQPEVAEFLKSFS